MGYETRVKQAVSWQPSQGQPNKLHQALDGLVIKALSRVCSRKLSQPGGGGSAIMSRHQAQALGRLLLMKGLAPVHAHEHEHREDLLGKEK